MTYSGGLGSNFRKKFVCVRIAFIDDFENHKIIFEPRDSSMENLLCVGAE